MKEFILKILKWYLRLLAKLTLLRYKPTIIGITGTVGKTSTKQAIGLVLRPVRRVRYSSKSFNNEFGLPLTILGDWEDVGGIFFWLKVITIAKFQLLIKNRRYPEVLVLEYGIDRPGDMKYLLGIARPHIGIFTALGATPVHVEFFMGPEGVLREKTRLLSQLPATGFAILNADDAYVMSVRNQTRAHVITMGYEDTSDMRISSFGYNLDDDMKGETFKLTYGGSFVPVRLEGVLGKGQTYAAAAGAAVGLVFGMNLVKIAEALREYQTPAGRLKLLKGIKNSTVIDDTYNASPLAMQEALGVIDALPAKRKIGAFGDMLELGKYTLEAHNELGRAAAKILDILVTVGLRGKFIAEAAIRAGMPKKSVFVFMSIMEAARFLEEKVQKGDVVLAKASQAVRMEYLVKELMAEPLRAEELLVRQSKEWLGKPVLYE